MPLDSPRSALFRSFLTCDNPKGVVESSITIRKSKAGSKKLEDKVNSPRVPKNFNTSSSYKEEGKEMVSTEIAKDLLKGALDLQESLAMLGKLQQASQQHVAELKKKQKVKSRAERVGEMGIERTNSHHFTDHNYQMGFRKLRLSDDGSSRDCFEKQEASESMAKLKKKQEEKSIGEKIGEMGIGKMNSHHFQDHNYQMGFHNPRISANDCFEELKTGIRDSLARQNLRSPVYDEKRSYCDKRTLDSAVDMDSTSSSQSSTANLHSFASSDSSVSSRAPQKPKRSNLIAKLMGLEEIPSQEAHFESDSFSSQRRPMFELDNLQARKAQFAAWEVDAEPRKLNEIVETMQFKGLLKSNSCEVFGPQFYHTNSSNSKQMFPEDAPPIVIIKPIHLSSGHGDESHQQRFFRDVRVLEIHEKVSNLKRNELQPQTMNHSEGSKNSEEMYERLKVEEDLSKEVEAKPEETALVKTNGKLSPNMFKVSVPVNQQRKREAVEKKVDRIQKVKTYRRKPAEMENVKSKSVCKSYGQAKATSTKERKSEIRSNITKAHVSQQKSTSSSPISKSTIQGISHSNGERRRSFKNEKPAKYPQRTSLIVEKICCDSRDLTRETDFDTTRTSSTITDQILIQGGTDAPETQTTECDSNQTFPCNVTPGTTQHESFIKFGEAAKYCISHSDTEKKCFKDKTNTKDLLLSSSSFHKCAEELFDINTNKAIVLGKNSLNDPGKTDSRLLLDSANELMQHKILRSTKATHPFLLTPARNSKISIALARLAEEACTVDEVERVVSDVEKIVFSGLIEEMFTDFVL